CSTAEISVATTGVLLMKPLSADVIVVRRRLTRHSLVGGPSTSAPTQRIAPVVFSAATSTKSTATVNTPGFQKPASAFAGDSTPVPMSTTTAAARTTSGLNRSQTSRASVARTTPTVSHPCQPSSITTASASGPL